MKIIRNKKELLDYADEDDAYDVDAHWVMGEVDYEYPVVIECIGCTNLGTAYKIRSEKDFEEVFSIFKELKNRSKND